LKLSSLESHLSWVSATPIEKTLDHTLLKPDATQSQFDQLYQEAIDHEIGYVCVPGARLESAVAKLGVDSSVKIACVMGFPHGNSHVKAKASEAALLLGLGATELDMVLDVGKMVEKDYHGVQKDIRVVVNEALHRDSPSHRIVKVILETCLLNDDQIIDACLLSVLAGAHFVKTSTGFSTGGATAPVVRLMKLTVGNAALVKASGGVRTYEDAVKMLHNGASRIGTSAGVSIAKASKIPSQ
jgi:deoxyribose-phosphate aldolase